MSLTKRLEIGLKNVSSALLRALLKQPPVDASPPYRKILFIRYGGIGDMILSIPVLRETRRKYPDAEIDVLCDVKNIAPIRDSDFISAIFIFRKNPLSLVKLLFRLRRNHYQFICNLIVYPSFTFGLISRLAGPKAVRVAGDQGRFSYLYNRIIPLPPKREIHMLKRLYLLSADLIDPSSTVKTHPWIRYGQTIQEEAGKLFNQILKKLSLDPHSARIVVINLSAGLPRREWPLEKWSKFLGIAVKKYETQIDGWAILTNPQKPGMAKQFADSLQNQRMVAVPPVMDFRVIMEFLRLVYILITPDTSISHAGSAMGTPELVLMIGENVVTWAPTGIPFQIVSSSDPYDLRELSAEAVLAGLEKLLKKLQ